MDKGGIGPIYIGLGANLAHPVYGQPAETLRTALSQLAKRGVEIRRISPFYRSAPVPASDQPWYVNAVAEVATTLSADRLLAELHSVEHAFGRARTLTNAARAIDLDLLDFRGRIAPGGQGKATLPHPRLANRAFVLKPLADLCPDWRHPATGASVEDLISSLPPDQVAERL